MLCKLRFDLADQSDYCAVTAAGNMSLQPLILNHSDDLLNTLFRRLVGSNYDHI
ncbi:hypothetical protein D3C81_2176840 [compost metagenome]